MQTYSLLDLKRYDTIVINHDRFNTNRNASSNHIVNKIHANDIAILETEKRIKLQVIISALDTNLNIK